MAFQLWGFVKPLIIYNKIIIQRGTNDKEDVYGLFCAYTVDDLRAVSACKSGLHVSPVSMSLWGQSPRVAKISLGYRSVEVVYLYGFKTMYDPQGAVFGGEYFGVFWNPLTVEKGLLKVSGGAGYFFRKYPTINGTNINFSLKLFYKISESIGIQYGHISNGFGVFNNLNPGVDNIGLVIAF